MTKTAIVTFGRFNPITRGHEKLFDILESSEHDSYIFPSHSEGTAKNPMPYDIKASILESIIDEGKTKVVIDDANNILEALSYLDDQYDDIKIVIGSDRLDEFNSLVDKYNGDLYQYNSIVLESSGDRSDDDISSSRMKEIVFEGDIKIFREQLCPVALVEDYVEYYNIIEKCLDGETENLFEEISNQARIKKAQVARRNKSKLKLGRSIAMKRKVGTKKLKGRSRKSAIADVKKKITKGKKASDLSFSEKKRAEKLLKKRSGLVDRLAKKGLKDARARQNSR